MRLEGEWLFSFEKRVFFGVKKAQKWPKMGFFGGGAWRKLGWKMGMGPYLGPILYKTQME